MFNKTIKEIENKRVNRTYKKKKLRRITPDLEYEARNNNLNDKELSLLEGLLKSQKKYPQLTIKQWNVFNKTCLKKQ